MSSFFVTRDDRGIVTPHWVEGETEILCTVELMKTLIDTHNKAISEPTLQEQIAQAIETLLEKVEALENYEPNIRISRNSQMYGVGFMECIKQVTDLIKEHAAIARNFGKEQE